MTWKILAMGDVAVLGTAASIIEAIRVVEHDVIAGVEPVGNTTPEDLLYLFATAARVWPDAGYDQIAFKVAEGAAMAFDRVDSIALDRGATGIALAIHYMWAPRGEDPLLDFDEQIADYVASDSPCGGEYDLLAGVVGLGVYALERMPRTHARRAVERVVAILDATAATKLDGFAWFTPVERLPFQKHQAPQGWWNLGVAHGTPGAIAFLARAAVADISPAVAQRASELVAGAINWLRVCRQTEANGRTWYPCAVGNQVTLRGRKPAWCYGDLGIAAILLLAARALGRPDWESEALATARDCAVIEGDGDVQDAALCHGAAGAMHLFNRMYQATSDPVLGEAARRWLARTLAMRSGDGVGYRSLTLDRAKPWSFDGDRLPPPESVADNTLLEGATGIALSLIAAGTESEPTWDRTLLLSPLS